MAGEGIYRFLLRMPEELRVRLNDAASSSGRSLNKEIVDRLEQSFEAAPQAALVRINGEDHMHRWKSRRTIFVLAAVVAALAAALGGLISSGRTHDASGTQIQMAAKQLQLDSQGTENGGAGGESAEAATASAQFAEARTAPSGLVNPGAYTAALGQLNGLGQPAGGSWSTVTGNKKYDADDIDYRDFYSNSGGGSGNVTGRITGLASDDSGYVYAAGADGGIWRSSTGGGNWTAIADALPSLSSGDLELNPADGSLWYATGEANTGGTSYVGSGVYRLASPRSGQFSASDRVGGTELESTTINKLYFSGSRVWAATLRGIWYHDSATASGSWVLAYAPNPKNLPSGVAAYASPSFMGKALIGTGQTAGNTNAAYANIVNDIVVDPKNGNHIVAAIGWRSGALTLDGAVVNYNGFYESNDRGATWSKINPKGGLDQTDIGNVSFAFSAKGEKLYAINQSPRLLNKLTGTVNSLLDGIYVSNSGDPAGPWSKIAESQKLANSGSALKQTVGGKGYGPGIQAWYNQFLKVDPTNPDHVYAGLEEVYETKDGGSNWSTVGPYWNFYFGCWAPDATYNSDTGQGNRCPLTTHSDQHAIAIGKDQNGTPVVYVGNDGGAYRRPLSGSTNANGNATDWKSLNDGTIDALQYYAVGIGALTADAAKRPDLNGVPGTDVLVSGGLQDNGGSLISTGGTKMVSNFGGDGGDVLVDPANGCNIVQEYVVLSMTLTQTCGNPGNLDAFLDLSKSTEFKIGPPDINARFIAPFAANKTNINEWIAGGNSLWTQTAGFAIRDPKTWTKAYTFADAGKVATAVAMNGTKAIAAYCGPCNNAGFVRGIAIGTKGTNGKWTFSEPNPSSNTTFIPRRYIAGVAVSDGGTFYAAVNGFSRRFTEGEGAGVGHVYSSADGVNWTDVSANFPDIPANSIQALSDGSLVVATDLAVLYRAPGATNWQRLGSGLPLTVGMDIELGPDNKLYVATHGRGIWSIAKP